MEAALYLRFIDDVFIIWDQGGEKLKTFIQYMNEAHQTIKFTAEYLRLWLNFLDTKVKIDLESKSVYTDLYTKDTDTHNYLHYTSSHPAHCKKGGPFGEFLRIRRNWHTLSDFDIHAKARLSDYLKWGYPKRIFFHHCEKQGNLIEKYYLERKRLSKPKVIEYLWFLLSTQPTLISITFWPEIGTL